MKNLKSLFCIFMSLSAVVSPVLADSVNDCRTKILLQDIEQHVRNYLPKDMDGRISVNSEILSKPFDLPECEQSLQLAMIGNQPLIARTSIKVSCQAPNWHLHLPINIAWLKPVVSLARSINQNEIIKANDLNFQEVNVLNLHESYLESKDQALGKLLRSPARAGSLLSNRQLSLPRQIKRGQQIWIINNHPGFSIRTQGRALEDGVYNQGIKIENLKSKRIIEGVVISQSEVSVGPSA